MNSEQLQSLAVLALAMVLLNPKISMVMGGWMRWMLMETVFLMLSFPWGIGFSK